MSLNQTGGVDLPLIASSTASLNAVIAELGDLIYQDPETQNMADRRCISVGQCAREARHRRAGRAGYARNAEALRAVQPEDVLPGDIDANLGAPWIPAATSRRSLPSCSASSRRRPDRPSEERRGVEHRCRPRRQGVGGRHGGIWHPAG